MAARKILQLEGAELTKAELNTLLKQLSDRIITLEDTALTEIPETTGEVEVLSSQFNEISDTVSNEIDGHTYTLPGNKLGTDGDSLVVVGGGSFESTSFTKTVKFDFGATSLTLAANAASGSLLFKYVVEVQRTGTNAVNILGQIWYSNTVLGNLTFTTSTEVLSSDIVLKSKLLHASGGTITENFFKVLYFPAP